MDTSAVLKIIELMKPEDYLILFILVEGIYYVLFT